MNDSIKEAAEARSNLNLWASIEVLLENSLLVGGRTHEPAKKVLDICKREIQKELKIYEAESRKAKSK